MARVPHRLLVPRRLLVLSAVALLAGGVAPAAADSAPAPAAIFTVYMAPTNGGGSDANDGLTPTTAVNTLVRVQQVLRAHQPTTDVEVRIKQGTYVAPPMHDWRFYIPGHTISFLPIDYEYGEGQAGIAGRPVFRDAICGSTYCRGYWLQPRLPTDPADPLYGGGTSGLRFYYLQVEYYSAGGISIYGDSERDVEDERYSPPLHVRGSAGLNGNTLFGMNFQRLGSRWSPSHYGWGAVVLTNSSDNRIENNHFVSIENASPYGGHIHGLYVTHFSSNNQILRNRFSYNSGDPVKVRNMSNFNTVEYNSFTRSGRNSFYRDEFCDTQCAIDNGIARQCASYHNRFFYNQLLSDYDGDNSSESWTLSPAGLTYAGAAPCTIPEGYQRLRTGGNTT